ncbi:MAG: hypothetical protein C9356_09950 [Oleiphilus sp.]|nr:MAG: hypothetical protein C9356_09950 [Oleiphilus sp.]
MALLCCFLIKPSYSSSIDCFQHAQNHYELAYCEIKARGEGRQLPDFIDFKNNAALTQYLLIKRDAKKLRIPLQPVSANQHIERRQVKAVRIVAKDKTIDPGAELSSPEMTGCAYESTTISCRHGVYRLIGNRNNRVLGRDALDADNRLGLAAFHGEPNNQTDVLRYLQENYVRYLEGMLRIGLGGVTMSYTKFHYLFHDIQRKGLSFHQRFETMYAFLKKDKANNAVAESLQGLNDISIAQCMRLKPNIAVCDNVRLNRIYLLDQT